MAPTVYNVTINPAAVPTIGSSNNPCINSTGNEYITNSGMSNYLWNISPGGTIISGQGTNIVNVTWNAMGAQWVSVSYTNSYGCAAVTPTVYNLFVNPPPNAAGAVTGTPAVCAGATGISYFCGEILNATSYVWTLPAGVSIVSGSGTNQIMVNFAGTAVSGIIKVAGNNTCGNGIPSPNFNVTVNPIPATPVITATGAVLTSSATSGNQWYFEGTAIPGATGQSYTATITGNYWCAVSLNGCASAISNKVYILITGTETIQNQAVNIFPVPNQGKFSVSVKGLAGEKITIRVTNSLGICMLETQKILVSGNADMLLDLEPVSPGVYMMEINNPALRIVRKVLVVK
jgi:hypothetical protein